MGLYRGSLILIVNMLTYTLNVPVFAEPQQLMTFEEFSQSRDSACYTVLQEGHERQPEYLCNLCLEQINKRVKAEDRGPLRSQLAKRECATITEELYTQPEHSGYSIFFDQDYLALDSLTDANDDRNYTSGIGWTQDGRHYRNDWLATPRNWLDAKLTSTKSLILRETYSRAMGLTAFTPDDIESTEPIIGDRPFASLIYLSNYKVRAYVDNFAIKSKLTLGILGLNVGKSLQRFMHNDLGMSKQDPNGWHNQISDGGEPTILYSFERVDRLYKGMLSDGGLQYDLTFSHGFNLGYHTDVSAGFDFRFGKGLNIPYYAYSVNPLSNYNHADCKSCVQNDFFFFLYARIRAVAYNALLQGQFRDSAVTYSYSDIESILQEYAAGFVWQISKRYQLTYSFNYKTKEYRGTQERSHLFGGLYFSYFFGKTTR